MSSSGTACVNPNESLESVLFRAPSCSLVTPKTNKAVPIRPLKRIKFADGGEAAQHEEAVVEEQAVEEEEERREALEPRRLDMDQMVALANPSVDDEEDEEEETPITQPYTPGEPVEEGELPSLPSQQQAAE